MQQSLLKKIFIENAARKLLALITAFIVWYIVSHSITSTKVFPGVSVRIINLPPDMTVRGLMPNGAWDRKLTLTLTGTKDILEQLGSRDFEVLIDASGEGSEWIAELGKKNLVSLNPDIDLMHNILSVVHDEFIITLSRLVTEKVPIYILAPKGEAPQGYQFLDVWPKKIMHTISGPEEDVQELQAKGLELIFDLSAITPEELDALQAKDAKAADQVSYLVPDSWKKVAIPFLDNIKQQINSPEAKSLRIDFLRNELLALDERLPLIPFYPLVSNKEVNPLSYPVTTNAFVVNENGILVINKPLFVKNISYQFLDAVKDHMAIVVLVSADESTHSLRWALQFIDPLDLEERYVSTLLTTTAASSALSPDIHMMKQEAYLRERFQKYMQTIELFFEGERPFALDARIEKEKIVILERH